MSPATVVGVSKNSGVPSVIGSRDTRLPSTTEHRSSRRSIFFLIEFAQSVPVIETGIVLPATLGVAGVALDVGLDVADPPLGTNIVNLGHHLASAQWPACILVVFFLPQFICNVGVYLLPLRSWMGI